MLSALFLAQNDVIYAPKVKQFGEPSEVFHSYKRKRAWYYAKYIMQERGKCLLIIHVLDDVFTKLYDDYDVTMIITLLQMDGLWLIIV